MPKIMLFQAEARAALARGVDKLTKTVQGTLGPKGGNTIIDRPVGTPIVSRDGVSIIAEIELEDIFENIGAQVAREVAMQTNETAGDGTTTAMILANALVQEGFAVVQDKVNPIDLVEGITQAIEVVIKALKSSAQRLPSDAALEAVAGLAANDPAVGRLVAEAMRTVGPEGIITVEFGQLAATTLEVSKGVAFDRSYLSHHMVTNVETMEAVLDNPLLLITDLRLQTAEQVYGLQAKIAPTGKPLLIIAEEVSPEAVAAILAKKTGNEPLMAAVHPPEFGKWRKALLEDIAILTGGRVLAKDLGARIEELVLGDLGTAQQIRVTADETVITGGGGDPIQIRGRRDHVRRQIELTEVMVDRDKLEMRLAKLSGGVATIRAGGVTPAERMHREQLIEDAINATRAALEEGVVAGGGTAFVQCAPVLESLIDSLSGDAREGVKIVQRVLNTPLRCIAENCGIDQPDAIIAQVAKAPKGTGFNARTGELVDMVSAGIMDPVKVSSSALKNAGSIAGLILTTQALIADKPEFDDPTIGPARGGGAERLGID
jgi:chaperonin GroEL